MRARRWIRTLTAGAVIALGAFPVVPLPVAHAAGPTVSGAGSTWSQIAVDQWRADVARRGLTVNFQGVGSSAGRQFYMIGQVDFAVSEIPFLPDELEKLRSAGRSFQYLPIVAGGTSVMYNLRDATGQPVTDLKLSASTLGGIFTGSITDWSDPAIARDNGGRQLPDQEIVPVIRSDGSGTSAQFSGYLAKTAPSIWGPFAKKHGIPNGSTSYWPNFPGSVAQKGSDGVANYVASDSIGVGSITYVEAGYAIQRGKPVASVKNSSGSYTQPTARNVAVALKHASFNKDRTQNLSGVYVAPEKGAYPISSYSYMITPTSANDLDPAKGKVIGDFIIYFACEGQQVADVLGYSPLPPNLVKGAFYAVDRIPGAAKPPALSECANPTLQGEGPLDPGEYTNNGPGGDPNAEGPGTNGSANDGNDDPADGTNVAGGGPSGDDGTAPGDGKLSEKELAAAAGAGSPYATDTPEAPSQRDLRLLAEAAARVDPISSVPFLIAALAALGLVFAPLIGPRIARAIRRR